MAIRDDLEFLVDRKLSFFDTDVFLYGASSGEDNAIYDPDFFDEVMECLKKELPFSEEQWERIEESSCYDDYYEEYCCDEDGEEITESLLEDYSDSKLADIDEEELLNFLIEGDEYMYGITDILIALGYEISSIGNGTTCCGGFDYILKLDPFPISEECANNLFEEFTKDNDYEALEVLENVCEYAGYDSIDESIDDELLQKAIEDGDEDFVYDYGTKYEFPESDMYVKDYRLVYMAPIDEIYHYDDSLKEEVRTRFFEKTKLSPEKLSELAEEDEEVEGFGYAEEIESFLTLDAGDETDYSFIEFLESLGFNVLFFGMQGRFDTSGDYVVK